MGDVKKTGVVLSANEFPLADMFANYLLPEEDTGSYGNLVAIYDLIPRFVGWQKTVLLESGICTDFLGEVKGSSYHVRMTAAAIEKRVRAKPSSNEAALVIVDDPEEVVPKTKAQTQTVFLYPGVREELVEDALRKFSVSGYGIVDGSQLQVKFTIRDLMLELASTGHTYSCNEIKEALNILNKAHLSIKIETESGAIEESSTYLPHLRFAHKRKVVDGNDLCIAQLHPLIVRAIRGSSFRLYGYRKSMELSTSLARTIHKHLSFYWLNASPEHPYTMNLVETLSLTSRGLVARMNDNTRTMEKALDELVASKILKNYEKTVVRAPKSKKIADVIYCLFPTNAYVSTIIKSNHQNKKLTAASARASLTGRGGRQLR